MSLKEQINEDFKDALRAKNFPKKTFLGIIKGNIQTKEGGAEKWIATDKNVVQVIKSLEKGIVETITARKSSNLNVTELETELAYLSVYKPIELTEDEIRVLIKGLIETSGLSNQGALIGSFNREYTDKAFDNKMVQKIIQEELA